MNFSCFPILSSLEFKFAIFSLFFPYAMAVGNGSFGAWRGVLGDFAAAYGAHLRATPYMVNVRPCIFAPLELSVSMPQISEAQATTGNAEKRKSLAPSEKKTREKLDESISSRSSWQHIHKFSVNV